MKLSQDLRDFIELLNSEDVQYLVIGGWAFNRYAEARFTGDIDFFVSDSADNQRKLRRVLEKFGFGSALPPIEASLFEKKIIMLGRPPQRIDLLAEISGINFLDAYSHRESGQIDKLPVFFISKNDLIINKRAAARDKDLLDLKILTNLPPR